MRARKKTKKDGDLFFSRYYVLFFFFLPSSAPGLVFPDHIFRGNFESSCGWMWEVSRRIAQWIPRFTNKNERIHARVHVSSNICTHMHAYTHAHYARLTHTLGWFNICVYILQGLTHTQGLARTRTHTRSNAHGHTQGLTRTDIKENNVNRIQRTWDTQIAQDMLRTSAMKTMLYA